jgi:hypothetical protein
MTDDAVLKSARNGFLVLILAVLAVGVYQITQEGTASPAIVATWVAGVLVFYGSKWYYGRRE